MGRVRESGLIAVLDGVALESSLEELTLTIGLSDKKKRVVGGGRGVSKMVTDDTGERQGPGHVGELN